MEESEVELDKPSSKVDEMHKVDIPRQ